MMTESETVSPPPPTWIEAAMSSGPSCRTTNHAMTAIWPANIAAKMNRPHSVVPQNFQIRGGRGGRRNATAGCGVKESINWPSAAVCLFVMPAKRESSPDVPGIHVFLAAW